MIYVACLVNYEPREKAPADVETTGDKLFHYCAPPFEPMFRMHDNLLGARTEADRLILADIFSRVLFASFEEYPQVTPEQFLLLQVNGGQGVIESCWRAVSNEAITDIERVLDTAFIKVRLIRGVRFSIDEALLAASMFLSTSDFHFSHEDRREGARGLLYEYCRLVTKHMFLTQLIVAGTALTERTAEVQAILESPLVSRFCFRC
jgi:hypothetical protein